MAEVSTNGDITIDCSSFIIDQRNKETVIPPKAYKSVESKYNYENVEMRDLKLLGEGYITKEQLEQIRAEREAAKIGKPKKDKTDGEHTI